MNYIQKIINETLNIFNEAIQYEYKIPENVKQQLFDFYIWSFAYQNINTADFYVLGTSSAYDLDNIIRESINKIVPAQKELLLQAGFFSILSELKYPVLTGWGQLKNYDTAKKIYDDDENRRTMNFDSYQKVNKRTSQFHSQKFIEFLQKNISNFNDIKSITKVAQDLKKQSMSSDDQKQVLDFVLNKTQSSKKDIVINAEKIFSYEQDVENYGGQAWQNICRQWIKLHDTKSLSETIKAIDDMYDLQHNTGFALNKDHRFQGDWIDQALDLKFSGNLWDLQPHSSIPQRIIGFISKTYNQPTKEDSSKHLENEFIQDITSFLSKKFKIISVQKKINKDSENSEYNLDSDNITILFKIKYHEFNLNLKFETEKHNLRLKKGYVHVEEKQIDFYDGFYLQNPSGFKSIIRNLEYEIFSYLIRNKKFDQINIKDLNPSNKDDLFHSFSIILYDGDIKNANIILSIDPYFFKTHEDLSRLIFPLMTRGQYSELNFLLKNGFKIDSKTLQSFDKFIERNPRVLDFDHYQQVINLLRTYNLINY